MSEHFFRPILFSGHSRVGGGSSAAAPKFCGVFRELSDSFLKKDYVKGTNGEVCHWDTPFSLFYNFSIKNTRVYFQYSLFLKYCSLLVR